jgi:DNA-binding CsgD family transcriptional regulator
VASIAKLLGVSPSTLYSHIPDLQELRAHRAPQALPPAEAGSPWSHYSPDEHEE